jgi:hypothetical protein
MPIPKAPRILKPKFLAKYFAFGEDGVASIIEVPMWAHTRPSTLTTRELRLEAIKEHPKALAISDVVLEKSKTWRANVRCIFEYNAVGCVGCGCNYLNSFKTCFLCRENESVFTHVRTKENRSKTICGNEFSWRSKTVLFVNLKRLKTNHSFCRLCWLGIVERTTVSTPDWRPTDTIPEDYYAY